VARGWKPPRTTKLLDQLAKAQRGQPQIFALRFPYYRNLVPLSRISFTFPLTVLVGKNGTNKSSLLHALYGAVLDNTPSKYWFDTAIDRIELEVNGVKNSLVTDHVDENGARGETLKYRTFRTGFEAYWEAAKRTSTYGFPPNSGRAEPVRMNVEYFDFRSELSAFDKFFYFPDSRRLKAGNNRLKARLRADPKLSKRNKQRQYSPQDYIRNRANALKKALTTQGTKLPKAEIDWISWILGREYVSAVFLSHSIYGGQQGDTVLLQANKLSTEYSSAFAGSGEFAVSVLVHKLSNVEDNSLILLDEPETSLHPTAQSRLRDFLLSLALTKKLQIVAATHSPVFIDGLPPNSVKLFRVQNDGKVEILDGCIPEEAFHEIDENTASQFQITVEDRAAKILVEAVIQKFPEPAKSLSVRVGHGGVPAMWRDIEARARDGAKNQFTFFDGDQRPSTRFPDPEALPANISDADLSKLVKALVPDSGLSFAAGDGSQNPRLKFLKFAYQHVEFLPGNECPEALVWNDDDARTFLKRHQVATPEGLFEANFKERFGLLEKAVPGQSWDAVYRQFVSYFVARDSAELAELTAFIQSIRTDHVVPRRSDPAAPPN